MVGRAIRIVVGLAAGIVLVAVGFAAAETSPSVSVVDAPGLVYQADEVDFQYRAENPGDALDDVRLNIDVALPAGEPCPTEVPDDVFVIAAVDGDSNTQGINDTFECDDGTLSGYWGPETGFTMPAGYDESTIFTVAFAAGAPLGDYVQTVSLVEVDGQGDVVDTHDTAEHGFAIGPGECDWRWTGEESSSWDDAGNWTDGDEGSAVPDEGDVVCIDDATNLPVVYDNGETTIDALLNTIDVDTEEAALRIEGGELTLAGGSSLDHLGVELEGGDVVVAEDFVVGGQSSWNGATVTGAGETTFADDLDLVAPGQKTVTGHEVVLQGTTTLTSHNPLHLSGGSTVTNLGEFVMSAGGGLAQPPTQDDNVFVNEGTLRKAVGSAFSMPLTAWLDNQPGGELQLQFGTLRFDRGGENHGAFEIDEGATAAFNSALFGGQSVRFDHLAGSSVTGDGTVASTNLGGFSVAGDYDVGQTLLQAPSAFTQSYAKFNTDATTGTLLIEFSRIRGPGTLTVTDDFTFNNGDLREGSTIDVGGDMELTGNRNKRVSDDSAITVAGSATHDDGLLWIEEDTAVTVAGDYEQIGGQVEVHGGTLGAATVDLTDTALLTGNAVVGGDVDNEGVVSPGTTRFPVGPGTLTVTGGYLQQEDGVLEIAIAGPDTTDFDSLEVFEPADLGGTLSVELIDEFVPNSGDEFRIVDAYEVFGTFDTVELPELSGRDRFEVDYEDMAVVLRVVTDPAPTQPAPQAVTESDGDDLLTVTVTSPEGGPVDVDVVDTESDAPFDWEFADVKAEIEAPDASVDDPIEIEFRLHVSQLEEGQDHDDVGVFRDGELVAECDDPEAGVADPDPCVQSRETVGDEVVITVLTSEASTWHLAVPEVTPDPDPEPTPEACPPAPFTDVDRGSVHAEAIDCAAFHDIAQGFADGTYRPAVEVRRDQMASFIARTLDAAGYTLPEAEHSFGDLDGNIHADAVGRLAAAGIVEGTSATTYGPAELVRRDQMAAFLVRALEWTLGGELAASGGPHFADTAGNTHQEAIDVAFEWGLTAGRTADVYGPADPVRRDQMATFLIRLHDRVE